eukprot:6531916-Prymnesium_polylepis.2
MARVRLELRDLGTPQLDRPRKRLLLLGAPLGPRAVRAMRLREPLRHARHVQDVATHFIKEKAVVAHDDDDAVLPSRARLELACEPQHRANR